MLEALGPVFGQEQLETQLIKVIHKSWSEDDVTFHLIPTSWFCFISQFS